MMFAECRSVDLVELFQEVNEDLDDAEIRFFLSAGLEVDDGSAVVVMDVAVSGASTDGTGLQTGLKPRHVGIKKRF